jgi:MFS family permease
MAITIPIEGTAAPDAADMPSLGYRAWFLFLLVLLSASIVSSRYVIFMLVEPIRHELNLNDKQISAVKDLAFVLAYVLTAVPIARLADTGSRRKLIAVAVGMWSLAAMLCSIAQGFWALLLGRGGIGLGEATFSAPAQALIADVFPARLRGTAISIFLLGATMGNWIGPAFGGWGVQTHGWRWTYFAVGIPGLILAPIAWLTLRDVRRGLSDGVKISAPPSATSSPSFMQTARLLMAARSLPLLILAISINALLTMGMVSWLPTFMERTHHMAAARAGAEMGGALFFGSLIGHTLGGPMTDLLGRRDKRWYVWVPMVTGAIGAAIAYFMLSGAGNMVFPLLFTQFCITGLSAAPMMAAVAALSPANTRATAMAILMVAINVIGFGLGPFLIATASDWLRPSYGEASLQIAMQGALIFSIPSTLFAWAASRTFTTDQEDARARLAG